MTTVVLTDVEVAEAPPPRWLQVVVGIGWIVVSLVILSLDAASMATIGYMVGFVLIIAGIDELFITSAAPGWKWLHAVLGVLFVVGGVAACLEPFQTFGYLALFVGWFLVIKGTLDLVVAIVNRDVLPLWGLLLAIGIGEILLGLWAIGYPGRSTYLVLLWAGFGAMFRGIHDLVAAFAPGGAR